MEIFDKYKLELRHVKDVGWYYIIHNQDLTKTIASSIEFFDSKGTARYAAIGHITILEQNISTSQSEHF